MYILGRILRFVAVIAVFFLSNTIIAQEKNMQLPHQEKVYLHFDQGGYYLNETMWYKAYVLDESNRLTDISKVLYVELVSPEGCVIKTNKHPIESGMCDGCFYLDSVYLSGFFEVRAYTRYMRNFGEDNYFTRVFPIYDQVNNGHYFYKTMYERNREERLLKRWEKKMHYKEQKDKDLEQKISTIESNVDVYNRKFTPRLITCTNLPGNISAGEKISLLFEAPPNSCFSLSITDLSTNIHSNIDYDIVHHLYMDNRWVKRSWHAIKEIKSPKSFYFLPEKGITIDGKLFRRKIFGIKKPYGAINVNIDLVTDSLTYRGKVQTFEDGYWAFELDQLYGDYCASLSVMTADDIILSVDKWFSPEARQYNDIEKMSMTMKEDTAIMNEDNDKVVSDVELNEVHVNAFKDNFFRYAHVSLLHIPFVELMERIWDDGYKEMYGVRDVGDYLFSYLGYPPGCARGIYVDDYPGDSEMPMMMQNTPKLDFNTDLPDDIREIVVRVDSLTCLFYDYKPPLHVLEQIGMNSKESKNAARQYYNHYFTNDKSTLYRWNYNNGDSEHIRYVVCFIKEPNGSKLIMKRNSPTRRWTYIRGYTIPQCFPHVDYSLSSDKLSNDFRRTLYWNPTVRTDSTGIAKVEFYNNSTCRELHISAEGIGGDMRPILYKSE